MGQEYQNCEEPETFGKKKVKQYFVLATRVVKITNFALQ